jgi:uncharacterized protein YbjQ (UPF0145 family)
MRGRIQARETPASILGLLEKIMRISSTDSIDGGRVLRSIGKIKAASAWHAAPIDADHDDWRKLALQDLIRRAEDVDADAVIDVDYETDRIVPVEQTGVALRRVLATGTAVKLAVVPA